MKSTGAQRDSALEASMAAALERANASRAPESCPQTELVAAWFDHSLSDADVPGIENHLSSCPRCQGLVAGLARSQPDVVYARPLAPHKAWTWHLRWVAPAMAAAIVLIVVGTESLRAPGGSTVTLPTSAPAATASRPVAGQAEQLVARNEPDALPAPTVAAPAGPPRDQKQEASPRPLQASAAPPSEPPAGAQRADNVVTEKLTVSQQPAPTIAMEGIQAGRSREDAARPAPPAAAPAPPPPAAAAGGAAAVSAEGVATTRMAKAAAMPSAAFAPDRRTGWRAIGPGVLSKTTDGGLTWTSVAVPAGVVVSAFAVVSPEVSWAVARGVVLRTTDGITWRAVSSPAASSFVAVRAHAAESAAVTAADGTTYETSDGGSTWRRR